MDLFLVQISIQLQVVKNNKIENQILLELKNFLIKNKNLSNNEIFSAIDKDFDGIINILFLNKFYILLIKKFNKARIKKEIINLLVQLIISLVESFK